MAVALPVFLTPLIGREQELGTLAQLLRHPGVRLVTVTGPGGVGKTRLAVAAAANLEDAFPAAISFVSLVPISDADFVWPTIANSLGIQDGDGASRPVLEHISGYIHAKPYLLIIDNFEHVIEAAAGIPNLLATCPNLKILTTSRERLRVRGEQEFAAPLLGLPDIERLAKGGELASVLPRYPAVQLFLERMRAIQANYQPDQAALRAIAGICAHLDGLPLAIELAAARTRMFTPQQLLSQLGEGEQSESIELLSGGARDLPARQRTLSRTIRWSYDLLPADEQRVFRAAAIFADGFALSDAEKLLERSPQRQIAPALTDMVASLVEKNLLIHEAGGAEPRFRMLVMLQAFGRAEAARLGEMRTLQSAHAATYLDLAETAVPSLYKHEQIETTARLRRDADNLRRALRWALDQDETEIAARFGAALWRFWLLAGLLSEGQAWLKEILARLGYNPERAADAQQQADLNSMRPPDTSRMADMLYGLGYLAYRRSGSGRPEVARWLSHSRDLYLQSGDRTRAALATTTLARANLFLFQHEAQVEHRRQLEESFEILRADDHQTGMAENLYAQAHNYFYLKEEDRATEAMQKSLSLLRETGNLYELAQATKVAGDLAFGWVGRYAEVRRHYSEAAEIFAALGNRTEAAAARAIVSVVTGWIDGEWEQAQDMVEEGIRVAREHGNERATVICMAIAAWVYASLGHYAQAKGVALEAIRSAFALSHHSALRGAFIGLAVAERLEGDFAAAVATISALMSYRTHYKSLSYSRGNSLHLAGLSRLQQELDPATFSQAWSRGPARLAELLPQAEPEGNRWPLAPVPEMQAEDIAEHQGTTTSTAGSESAGPEPAFPEPLTGREKEVLKYLVEGLTDPEIAEALVISPRTVHAHLRNIYGKLGVNSRTAAARLVLEHELI